jgi:predicted DNA-binding protein
MRAIDRLYRKEKMITRSIHLDDDLYCKLEYLSNNIFDATISKIINVCIEDYLQEGKFEYYRRPEEITSIYRSIFIRESFYDALNEVKNKKGISFTRLLNAAIKNFIDKYIDELK